MGHGDFKEGKRERGFMGRGRGLMLKGKGKMLKYFKIIRLILNDSTPFPLSPIIGRCYNFLGSFSGEA
jgi:hypothetical protein